MIAPFALTLRGVGDVIFNVRGARFPLDERKATILAEELRRTAAGQLGEYGLEGARPVADNIEEVLVGRSDGPVAVEGADEEEALFYALNIGAMSSSRGSPERVLYDAVRALHEERLRDEGSAPSP